MTKRPGAAAVTGAALLALLCPAAGSAVAQDTEAFERTVSDGHAAWTTTVGHDLSIDVTEPAQRGSGDRTSFPATGGSTDPETGAVDVELGGAVRLVRAAGPVQPLTLAGLRLRLDGAEGILRARTAVDGRARELALADVTAGGDGPVVRTGGVTWTGLRASLTDAGAKLLTRWSGEAFARGDALGLLDLTVGTDTPPSPGPTAPGKPPAETAPPSPSPDAGAPKATPGPAATVTVDELTAGSEQTVNGTGFDPGEVVLVAIDDDTRYQAVADETGRLSRTFPVYATATEGVHTVELATVTGERGAVADFDVRASD